MSAGDATRRQALARGLVAGSTLAAGSAAGLGMVARAAAKGGDTALVERAIRIEQEAAVLYGELAEGDLLDEEVGAAAAVFTDQQREHVGALTAALDDSSVEAPPPPRPMRVGGLEAADSQDEALEAAVDLENALIRAYGEIAESSADAAILKTVVEIACNAAQHLVVLRQQLGEPPLPEALETGESPGG